MNDCMAIGTDWTQIFYGINLVFTVSFSDRFEMMYVDKIFANLSINVLKFELANTTTKTVMRDALCAGDRISFIGVDLYCAGGALIKRL